MGYSVVLAYRINQPLSETNESIQLPNPACFFQASAKRINQSVEPIGSPISSNPRSLPANHFGQQKCVRVFCLTTTGKCFSPLKHERLYTRAQAKSIVQFSAKSEQSPSG